MLYDPQWERDPRPDGFSIVIACTAAVICVGLAAPIFSNKDELAVTCSGSTISTQGAIVQELTPARSIFSYR
jgi:hypothetical protein